MNKYFKIFITPPAYAQMRIPSVIFFLSGEIAFLILSTFYIIPAKIKAGNTDEFFLVPIIYFIFIAGLFITIGFIRDFWRNAYFIDLTDDRVIAYNLWRQPKEMMYNDIVLIKKQKKQNMFNIKSAKGDEIIIISVMDNFGYCLEMIAESAVNVKEVDFGGLDKQPAIWYRDSGWYERYPESVDKKFKRKVR